MALSIDIARSLIGALDEPALIIENSRTVAANAAAQGGRSEINGTIVDAQKALLPGVTVTAINQDTGLERTTVSSTEGKFTIPTLLPGTYTIKAELQGFQVTNLSGIVVNVGQELTVNLTMQLAGVAETVMVTGFLVAIAVVLNRLFGPVILDAFENISRALSSVGP